MANDDPVLYERRDQVALLTLNRPERLNAWTAGLERAYFDYLEQCAGDPDVRVVVVTGAGRGWCAGADMDALQSISGGAERGREASGPRRRMSDTTKIPKPVIAAING